MQTIKIPFECDHDIKCLILETQHQYTSALHFAYNRVLDGNNKTEIFKKFKNLNNIDLLDGKILQSCISEAFMLHKARIARDIYDPIVFGGKRNLRKYNQTGNKIWLERYQKARLHPIYVVGGNVDYGNMKITLDFIQNNRALYTWKHHHKSTKWYYQLKFPNKIGKNYCEILRKLEILMHDKMIPVTIRLSTEYIWLTFDEKKLNDEWKKYKPIKNRIAAIDMNPNYIGLCIIDGETEKYIDGIVFSNKLINDREFKLHLPSKHPKRIKINNIRKHENFEVCKTIVNIVKHYQCEAFVVEKLDLKPRDNKIGKHFNRLVNNLWNRTKVRLNLQKRCNIAGIRFIEVYPQYSSTIGALKFPELPDMVAAACELARRGYKLLNYKKGDHVMYPQFDRRQLESRHWKDSLKKMIRSARSWVSLHDQIKKSGHIYRFPLLDWYDQVGVLNPCTIRRQSIKIYSVL